MKPILILNLGGTICMSSSKFGLVPDSKVLPEFLSKHYPDLDYLYREPFRLIDSSQANYAYWNECAQYIQDHHQQYRGVIITHGTDTMAYFGASLRFYFASISLPIIITGSQSPLTQPHNDAIANVQFAIDQIDGEAIKKMGIAIAFNQQLLHAEKTSKVDTQSNHAFAQNCESKLHTNSAISNSCHLRELHLKKFNMIWMHPAFDYKHLPKVDSNIITIIKSYGAGNLPKHPLFSQYLQQAKDQNALIINHSQCFYSEINMEIYEAGNWLGKYNVLGARNLTIEALMAKLHCINSSNIQTLKEELLTPYHYELA